MFVKPNNGLSVRDPVKGTLLPDEGAEVPDNVFWHRRLRDEDVVIAEQPGAGGVTTAASVTSSKKEGDNE